jgi:dolichol-phosphate mannosyltransferase
VKEFPSGISLLIPCRNEAENINSLSIEIEQAFLKFPDVCYEVIWIDDHSSDHTFEVISQLPYPNRVIRNLRRLGQSGSLNKGFQQSRYSTIGIIDGDGQNVPSDILEMYFFADKTREHFIQGFRIDRKDRFFVRKLPSYFANLFIRRILKVNLNDLGCGTKLISREIISEIPFTGEIHRIYAAHAHFAGFEVQEFKVQHRPRSFGESNYGINRIFKFVVDITFARLRYFIESTPGYALALIALTLACASFLSVFAAFYMKITGIKDYFDGALMVGGVIIGIGSFITFLLGVILEILMKNIRDN